MALLAGLQAMAVCWPWDLVFALGQPVWWLQIAALGGLYRILLALASVRAAFLVGWWFATVWLAATFWWLYISMHTYGGLPSLLAVLAVLALAAALGIYYGLAAAFFKRSVDASRPRTAAIIFAAAWLLAELARGVLWTGFGWGAIGYAHIDGPLQPFIPWVGAYGLAALAAALAALWLGPRVGWMAKLFSVVVVWAASQLAALGQPEAASTGNLSVSLLQGNIAQDEKFMAGTGVPKALSWYGQQLQAAQGDLVVAPETAIPLLPHQLPDDYWEGLRDRFRTGSTLAIIGIPLGSWEEGYSNSVLGLMPGNESPWRYDKHHLVPFGEFIPPAFRWFTELMNIPLGDFKRGALGQPSIAWKGQRLAPNICYEDLFGEELAARFVAPSLAPTIFVNVSNIAWFGRSVAIDQHLQISRMRALEFARPFIRATNTGATAVIDHQGRVTDLLPYHQVGVLQAQVQGRSGMTPFAWWAARFGLWPLWLLASAVLAGALLRRPKTDVR